MLATVGDHLDEELRLKKLVGRLATYLQGYGDLMVRVNGWDPEALARFRADEFVAGFGGGVRRRRARPRTWRRSRRCCPTSGSPQRRPGRAEQCAQRVLGQFDLGADGVILHGATPAELEPVVAAYRERRPGGRFDGLPANPGASRP